MQAAVPSPTANPAARPTPTEGPTSTPINVASPSAGPSPATTIAETTPPAREHPSIAPLSLGKWIDVDIGDQAIAAYHGGTLLKKVLVSTGLARYPTVIGRFAIYTKVRSQSMSGGSRFSGDHYFLPGVPHVMFFYAGYAIHGTYWHNNFGRPMSRGCVNLTLEDAKWFYEWAEIGTPVIVHL